MYWYWWFLFKNMFLSFAASCSCWERSVLLPLCFSCHLPGIRERSQESSTAPMERSCFSFLSPLTQLFFNQRGKGTDKHQNWDRSYLLFSSCVFSWAVRSIRKSTMRLLRVSKQRLFSNSCREAFMLHWLWTDTERTGRQQQTNNQSKMYCSGRITQGKVTHRNLCVGSLGSGSCCHWVSGCPVLPGIG